MPVVLHVGCGRKDLRSLPTFFQDGTWSEVRFDIDPEVGPDVLGTMTDMLSIASGSMDAIFSSHNVEHLFPHEVPIALGEFRRVLCEDGFALITCPDLQMVAKFIAEDRVLETLYESNRGPIAPLDILFGHRNSIARGNHFMAHRGGFTLRTLAAALQATGFAQVIGKRRRPNLDLWMLALVKPVPEAKRTFMASRLFPE